MRAAPLTRRPSTAPAAPAPVMLAVRVACWAMVAGVTGCLANALLATMYADLLLARAGAGAFAWAGPANDVVGAVSTAATIPVVLGLRTLIVGTRAWRVLAMMVPAAAVAPIVSSALLVAGTKSSVRRSRWPSPTWHCSSAGA